MSCFKLQNKNNADIASYMYLLTNDWSPCSPIPSYPGTALITLYHIQSDVLSLWAMFISHWIITLVNTVDPYYINMSKVYLWVKRVETWPSDFILSDESPYSFHFLCKISGLQQMLSFWIIWANKQWITAMRPCISRLTICLCNTAQTLHTALIMLLHISFTKKNV